MCCLLYWQLAVPTSILNVKTQTKVKNTNKCHVFNYQTFIKMTFLNDESLNCVPLSTHNNLLLSHMDMADQLANTLLESVYYICW